VTTSASASPTEDERALREVEQRVLWLATSIVHAANRRPDDGSGLKVGGHQASSASMVTIMTALWFDALSAADRVSVKPHASPVLHAVNHLLGRLDASWLPRLREFGGLQPYPSRTKDPDVPDYSTGSVGIGATAPVWGAIARRYASAHLDVRPGGRQISLLGDAELDEGAVWECVADPLVQRLGEVLWVVDVNRQSLDRIVPEIAVRRWAGMFEAAGWQVLDVKYGRRLQEVFARPGGELLRARIDGMDNEEYQWLLRASYRELRAGLARDDERLAAVLSAYRGPSWRCCCATSAGTTSPSWAARSGPSTTTAPPWCSRTPSRAAGCRSRATPATTRRCSPTRSTPSSPSRSGRDPPTPGRRWTPTPPPASSAPAPPPAGAHPVAPTEPPPVPTALGRRHRGTQSTQAALGAGAHRPQPRRAGRRRRVVTVSPGRREQHQHRRVDQQGRGVVAAGPARLVRVLPGRRRTTGWCAGARRAPGQHLALGIAEVNLVCLLGELGATWSTLGQPLLPIGTSTTRSSAARWSRGCSAPTPAAVGAGRHAVGVTLASEGGAHQSITTPSIGLETPGVTAVRAGLRRRGRSGACSTRFAAWAGRTASRPTCA
jgi:pyruvate dehydrogenase E1 component